MIKRTDSSGEWQLFDNQRDKINSNNARLWADLNSAETSNSEGLTDFLSNGFKLRASLPAAYNASGGTFIFAAFAETPFKTANAR